MVEISRRNLIKIASFLSVSVLSDKVYGSFKNSDEIIDYFNRKIMPVDWQYKNSRKRAKRKETKKVILHTCEISDEQLLKLFSNGEHNLRDTNYFIDEKGKIFPIIYYTKISKQVGRSEYEGLNNLDDVSINVTVSGNFNGNINKKTYNKLGIVIEQLKDIYPNLIDDDFIPHSEVGVDISGNNRNSLCGIVFSDENVRKKVGLKPLNRIYNENKNSIIRKIPSDFNIEYLDGIFLHDNWFSLVYQIKESDILGYKFVREVKKGDELIKIIGKQWNFPSYVYLQGNKVYTGDNINPRQIQPGDMIFRRT